MSALEGSVTLEDVFTVVESKRVPLAPELAGYLALEVADGADGASGEVDPRTVYISEEGTVALVRPKKDAPAGETETSVRALLAKLLDASGSATPALSAAAKKNAGAGLPALVQELEAALIPVNRAAGRRALARLAREVKRVALGIGRNASAGPIALSKPPPAPLPPSSSGSGERPRVAIGSFGDEASTARRGNQLAELAAQMSAPEPAPPPKGAAVFPGGLTPPPVPGARRPGPAAAPPPPARPQPRSSASLPKPKAASAPPGLGPRAREGAPLVRKADKLFGGDEVESLLASFEVSDSGDNEMSRDLKAIAGLDPTPHPESAMTIQTLAKDIGKEPPKKIEPRPEGDGVEALLALSDTAGPVAPAPKTVQDRFFPQSESNEVTAILGGPPTSSPQSAPPSVPPPDSFAPPSPLVPSSMLGQPPPSVGSLTLPRAAPTQQRPPFTPLGEPPQQAPMPPMPMPGPFGVPLPHAPLPPPPAHVPVPAATPAPPSLQGPPSGNSSSVRRETTRRTKKSTRRHTGERREPRAPKTGLVMAVLTLFVLIAGAFAVWKMNPAFFTGHKKPIPSASVATQTLPPAPRCKVALVVSDVPANAEILLRMGQSPLDVERMPVGTRLEFVATAEGYAPRRAIIKAESTWDKGPDGKPRIDVPIQLDPSKAKPGSIDPWPAAEPGSQVGGSGSPGTVHVVANVRGSEVWLLAGLGPEARIEQLRCDSDIDVLLAGPSTLRKRLHVGDKDVAAAPSDSQGNKVIGVSAK